MSRNEDPRVDDLQALRRLFDRNPVRAILLARRDWRQLPPSLARDAQIAQKSAAAQMGAMQIQQEVNAWAGSYGISPSYGGMGFGGDPAEHMFVSMMGSIVAHRGDPPPSSQLADSAFEVATGQVPIDAMLDRAIPGAAGMGSMLAGVLGMAGGAGRMITSGLLQTAALSVPRDRIEEALELISG